MEEGNEAIEGESTAEEWLLSQALREETRRRLPLAVPATRGNAFSLFCRRGTPDTEWGGFVGDFHTYLSCF